MEVQYRITPKCPVLHVCPLDRTESRPKPSSFLSADSAGEALSFAWFLFLCGVSGVTNSLERTQGGKKKEREEREKFLAGKMKGCCHLAKYVGQISFA